MRKSETQVDPNASFIGGKRSNESIKLSCIIIRTMTMKGEQKNFNREYTHSGTDNFSRVLQSFLSLYVIQRNLTALTKR